MQHKYMQDADRLTCASDGLGPPFRLVSMRCYDMFPFTAHVETLGVFVRDEVGTGASAVGTAAAKLSQQPKRRPRTEPEPKFECQIYIGVEQDNCKTNSGHNNNDN